MNGKKPSPKGITCFQNMLLTCANVHQLKDNSSLQVSKVWPTKIFLFSLKCTVLARDRFYRILLEQLEAKLKVAELIITNTGHNRIIRKNLIQIRILKLPFEQNLQNTPKKKLSKGLFSMQI